MKKLLAATAITLTMTILTTGAIADANSDIKKCNKYADGIVSADRSSRQTSRAVSGVASFMGSVIAGGSTRYAAGSAIRSQGYGVSTDMRMAENKRKAAFNQCMSDNVRKSR